MPVPTRAARPDVEAGLAPSVQVGLVAAVAAASAAGLLRSLTRPAPGPERWRRLNAAGQPVTLLEGPALAAGSALALALAPAVPPRTRAAGLLAIGSAAALGAYDDVRGSGADRGLRGHLGAARRGELSTGLVKVVGLTAAGLGCGALVRPGLPQALVAAGVVAGSANLANLLDLRPGRALKVALLTGCPLVVGGPPAVRTLAAAPLGAALGVLPDDLAARSMLGDSGANALGAAVGTAAAARLGTRSLAALLAVLTALTLASERVSFTRVIEATPGLRELDALGRRAPRPHSA